MPRLPIPAVPSNLFRPGMRPVRLASAPPQLYTERVTVPIPGGQASGVVPASGKITLSVGPTGLGTVWYPASAVVSTSLGPTDGSTCSVYVGAIANASALQGTLAFQGGGGVVSMAVPQVSPGLLIIAVWTNATVGSTATLNITGTASMLTRAS